MSANDTNAKGSAFNAGILLNLPRFEGVDPLDPAGTLPPDAKQNGIVCIIDRWPNFPVNARIDRVEIFLAGNPNFIAWAEYGAADNAPEFHIPIGPGSLPDLPTFEIYYRQRSINWGTAPSRRLTFAVGPPKVLKAPTFPDTDIWNYITCTKSNPQDPESLFVWEGIRIFIPFDNRFNPLDEIELVWQGWDQPNGKGNALTAEITFMGTVTDVTGNKPVVIIVRPFPVNIEPMRDRDSASASYVLVRNRIPMFSSFTGYVNIDRKPAGGIGYCSGGN